MTLLAAKVDSPSHELPDCRQSWLSRVGYILPAFVVCLLVCLWFVTWGTWRIFEPDVFCGYYDAQARALLHGRLDVPLESVGFEAFIRDGKSYGYFGLVPALLRIPLMLVFPDMDGRWSRLAILVACTLNLIFCYRLLLVMRNNRPAASRLEMAVDFLFVLCAGIGSSVLYIASRSFIFHEAIMWGSTFALMFSYYLICYFRRPTLGLLGIAGLFAFLSFHSRPTAGAGAILALGIVFAIHSYRFVRTGSGLSRSHALLAGGILAVTGITYCGVNYLKFRTLDGVPLRYYVQYAITPARMQDTRGKQIHLTNFRTGAMAYFGLDAAELHPEFPWIYMSAGVRVFPEAAIDEIEPHSSIPLSMPALFILACAGVRTLIRRSKEEPRVRQMLLPVVAMLLGGSIVIFTVGITHRYIHDFYPFLILAGAIGASRIGASQCAKVKIAMLALLVVSSIAINSAFAYEHQCLIAHSAPPEKRQELERVRSWIGRAFHRGSLSGAGTPTHLFAHRIGAPNNCHAERSEASGVRETGDKKLDAAGINRNSTVVVYFLLSTFHFPDARSFAARRMTLFAQVINWLHVGRALPAAFHCWTIEPEPSLC